MNVMLWNNIIETKLHLTRTRKVVMLIHCVVIMTSAGLAPFFLLRLIDKAVCNDVAKNSMKPKCDNWRRVCVWSVELYGHENIMVGLKSVCFL